MPENIVVVTLEKALADFREAHPDIDEMVKIVRDYEALQSTLRAQKPLESAILDLKNALRYQVSELK